jgi:hypothetical protein
MLKAMVPVVGSQVFPCTVQHASKPIEHDDSLPLDAARLHLTAAPPAMLVAGRFKHA